MLRSIACVLNSALSFATLLALGLSNVSAPSPTRAQAMSDEPTFRTIATFASATEGLTGDEAGNLYVAGRGTDCPVWRVNMSDGATTQIGVIPGTCATVGMAFDATGQLHVLSGDGIYRLAPSAPASTPATQIASGMPGANGLAFERSGAVYVSDAVTSQGRVYRVSPSGEVSEAFRVPAMSNDVNAVDGVGGVGRDHRTLPPGTVRITPTGRPAADSEGTQAIVANGVAFGPTGTLFIADTARGAIWAAELDGNGNLLSPTGCDTTYPANTLCMDSLLAAHPSLAGADGIAVDAAGNVWVAANERNALVMVSPEGRVTEVFRNASDPDTRLRNTGPLEFPTSVFIAGTIVCLSHTDSLRADNAPPSAGELAPGSPLQGKISCMNEPIAAPGLPLPAR